MPECDAAGICKGCVYFLKVAALTGWVIGLARILYETWRHHGVLLSVVVSEILLLAMRGLLGECVGRMLGDGGLLLRCRIIVCRMSDSTNVVALTTMMVFASKLFYPSLVPAKPVKRLG